MATELRKTGINVVGDVPWGTHFCHFYKTKQDLLDTLVPYFKAGLESKEFCLWVVSDSDLITVAEARGALAQAVPDLDRHLAEENIEILRRHDWYFEEHALNLERAKHGWDAKLNRALARGYEGLRASADTFWLAEKDWKDFFDYEKQVNDWITNQSMTVMCTYPLAKSGASELFDVVRAHQFAIARRQGEWEVIETPELIQAKAEIKRLNEELEQRVVERTRELAATNDKLIREIVERKRTEEAHREAEQALSASETKFRRLLDSSIIGVVFWSLQDEILDANDLFLAMVGYTREDLRLGRLSWKSLTPPEYADVDEQAIREMAATGACSPFEKEYVRKDGSRISVLIGSALFEGKKDTGSSFVMDITERRRVEEAHKESKLQYETLVQSIDGIVWEADPKTFTFTFVSKQAERLLGYPLEQWFEGSGFWPDHMHPDDRDWAVKFCVDATARGENHQFEYRMIAADGHVVWFSDIVTLHVVDDQSVILRGLMVDITERKQAEEALDERLRFETLVTELSAAFANLSPNEVDREIDKWLQTLVEFLGVDRASFFQFEEDWTTLYLGHSYTVPGIEPLSMPSSGINEQFPWITDQLRRGNTIKWSRIPDDMPEEAAKEKKYAATTGAKSVLNIPVLVGGSVICTISFTSIGIYCDWPDATVARLRLVGEIFAAAVARKRAEVALRKSEEQFRQIAENIREVFWLRTADLSKMLYISPAYEAVWGQSRESLYREPRSFFAAIHAEDRSRVVTIIERDREQGFEVEYRVVRPDGSIRWIRDLGFPIKDESGCFYRVAGIAENITELKEAEEQLKATSEQLRALSASVQSAREEEAARIAREIHDELGSALTSLKLDLELLRRDELPSTSDTGLSPLREKAMTMIRLVDQTIERVRRISSELRPSVLDDIGLVAAIRWQSQQFEAQTGIVCRCDCGLEDMDLGQQQSTAIFRVFQEALTNILRHAQASRVDITLEKEDDELVLTVMDNGRGITADEKSDRLSLGLLGMRERINLIGATIHITGVEGKGTVIAVRLPMSTES